MRSVSPRSSTSRSRLGVFGTLSVQEVIDSGGTALAVAAEPPSGEPGYWLMSVTGSVRHRRSDQRRPLPGRGLSEQMAATGQFPPLIGRRLGGRSRSGCS